MSLSRERKRERERETPQAGEENECDSVDPTRRRKETPNVHARTLDKCGSFKAPLTTSAQALAYFKYDMPAILQYAAEFAAADIVLLSNGASRFWGSRMQREKKEEDERRKERNDFAKRRAIYSYELHTHTHTHSFTGIPALFALLLLFHDKSKQLYGTVASGG